jgi:hypothetical protein
MGKMSLVIDDNLQKRFRIKVIEKLGNKKGALSEAVSLAMEKWLQDP